MYCNLTNEYVDTRFINFPKIKAIPNIMHLQRNGGDGVVREFVELILS